VANSAILSLLYRLRTPAISDPRSGKKTMEEYIGT